MENEIKHFIHEHPLRMEKGVIDDERCFCLLCHKDIASPMYSCCNEFCLRKVYMHKSCAQFPQVMLHPFHPHPLTFLIRPRNEFENFDCDACWMSGQTHNNYHCFDCDFNLDICCASLMPVLSASYPSMEVESMFALTASACSTNHVPSGLHRSNILSTDNTHSPCLTNVGMSSSFVFQCDEYLAINDQCEDSSQCSACGKLLAEGFSFNCSECNFSLDPLCASFIPLPSSTQILKAAAGTIRGGRESVAATEPPIRHPSVKLADWRKSIRIRLPIRRMWIERIGGLPDGCESVWRFKIL